ncbi:Prolyl-tRNA synthetase associated domain-containing protein 1 [Armadillidium nasatum]|uniref:PrdX deacylase domain-containing protein 1 n=1 Tax=Armadillidium nasatum TaxID=96803 RepID=A0A5N5SQE4_9CRUS|nr:Prolyl-tRNA synthetase associated domain-containing protein 1 [Armadillidium nasatum]
MYRSLGYQMEGGKSPFAKIAKHNTLVFKYGTQIWINMASSGKFYSTCEGDLHLSQEESESYANPKEKKFEEKTIIKKHFSRGDLEKFFNENGIKFQSRNHKEVFTVDTLMDEVGDMPGLHMKNLFLKDKKKNLYLLCARHDSKINLNDVAKKIGAKELRFADENTLKDVLGVTQGCVTLYALVNDPENRVHILLDSEAY